MRIGLKSMSVGKGIRLAAIVYTSQNQMRKVRERSSITSAHWRGVGGLTENADAADASRGGGGSQDKIDDVILEHIC